MKSQHMLVYGGIVLCLSLLYLIWRGGGVADGFANKGPEFAMIYAEWCPHCKVIKDDDAFRDFLTNPIRLGTKTVTMRMIDGDSEEGKSMKVEGYPTFRFYKEDGSFEEYKGARDMNAIKAYITDKLKN